MSTRSGKIYSSNDRSSVGVTAKVTDDEERFETCENCSTTIDCFNSNIYIIQRGDDDKCLCLNCFEDLEDQWKAEGWLCDDWDSDSESD